MLSQFIDQWISKGFKVSARLLQVGNYLLKVNSTFGNTEEQHISM